MTMKATAKKTMMEVWGIAVVIVRFVLKLIRPVGRRLDFEWNMDDEQLASFVGTVQLVMIHSSRIRLLFIPYGIHYPLQSTIL
jgi:hypothetical protein